MNKEERIQRLRDFGYPIIHLFGNWYLGRIWSKNYKRFSFWRLFKFPDYPVIVDDEPVKPKGEYRLNK